jgi:pimeloyl-ACP methyl ester carboxylesterase
MISALTVLTVALPVAVTAQPQAPAIGIVIMHGKGGSPGGLVGKLAGGLERKGWLVANLEMPWSGRRGYDADVAAAEQQVNAALEDLRGKGAKKVFVAGHSQGGVFALHYASKHPPDGVIAIAPGGSTSSAIFRQQLGASVELAREMVAAGKGNERAQFLDYEGSRGTSPVRTTAVIYLSWFDPDGAMNQQKSARGLNPGLPVLYVAPRNDYPGLQRVRPAMYGALPANPLTRLYEPDSDHAGAPSASTEEIARWATEVAAR